MTSRVRSAILAATALPGLLAGGVAAAAAPLVSAGDWQASCADYLATLRGEEGADDLKITYCVGQTQGIIEAMGTASQIGAVSFASTATVAFGLDQAQVFALFEKMRRQNLLGVCPPDDTRVAGYVETVDAYLRANPDKAGLSVAVVFFEAMQSAWPCPVDEPGDSPSR